MLRILRYPPVVTLLFMLMMLLISCVFNMLRIQLPIFNWLAVLIFILSILVILSAGWAFKKAKTTVDPTTPYKTTELVTTGIYQYSRNPMYVGLFGFLLAEASLLGNPLCLIVIPFYIYTINMRFMKTEEKALKTIFGEQFVTYSKQVRMWL